MDKFTEFLLSLNQDVDKLSRFREDPDSILDTTSLSHIEKILIKSGRSDLLLEAVDPLYRGEVWIPLDRDKSLKNRQEQQSNQNIRLGSLTVVGTGIQLNHATLETRFHIENADKVFYLTADQSTTDWIEKLNSTSETLYTFYEPGQERIISYHRMVDRILSCVREGLNVCVVLYGHPGVFAYPTHEAVRRARIEGFKSKMLPAISAEDCLFAEVGVDPGTSGCQSFEATDFLVHKRKFDTSCSLILWQIGVVGQTTYEYQFDMSRIRVLVNYLETYYDPAHEVVIYEAAQYLICDSIIERVPLKRVPESQKINPISTLYVPPTASPPPDPVMMELLGLCIPKQNC